jgi:hypothetical protein
VVLLAGCAAPREAVEPPGAAPAPSGTRGPPTAPIARIEPGAHTAPIKRIDTDAAGRLLITGSDDKTVRLWSLPDGKPLKTLRVPIGGGSEGKIYAVAISPDGGTVAAGGWTGYEWDGLNSIYLYEVASGRLVKRLAGLPDVINDLNYSPDARYLAAGLGGTNGIRIYRTHDWEPVYADSNFRDGCYSVDFAADGRLVGTSLDGRLRLYALEAGRFRLVAEQKAPGGSRPYTARFSPDGKQIAVGFDDSTAVNVLDGQSLAFLYAPETRDVDNGDLAKVAWSQDGQYLYGGGRFARAALSPIRRWDESGRGPYRDLPASYSTLAGFESLKRGGWLVYGAQDPAFGVFDATGRKVLDRPSGIADFRGMGGKFLLSRDGRTVQFGLDYWGEQPMRFSLDTREDASLRPPRTELPGIRITDWENVYEPKLNGKPLALEAYERLRSLAVHPGGKRFLLGTEWYLRYFDAEGRELWQLPAPSVAWEVNFKAGYASLRLVS